MSVTQAEPFNDRLSLDFFSERASGGARSWTRARGVSWALRWTERKSHSCVYAWSICFLRIKTWLSTCLPQRVDPLLFAVHRWFEGGKAGVVIGSFGMSVLKPGTTHDETTRLVDRSEKQETSHRAHELHTHSRSDPLLPLLHHH
jgi:hypothetical protein